MVLLHAGFLSENTNKTGSWASANSSSTRENPNLLIYLHKNISKDTQEMQQSQSTAIPRPLKKERWVLPIAHASEIL